MSPVMALLLGQPLCHLPGACWTPSVLARHPTHEARLEGKVPVGRLPVHRRAPTATVLLASALELRLRLAPAVVLSSRVGWDLHCPVAREQGPALAQAAVVRPPSRHRKSVVVCPLRSGMLVQEQFLEAPLSKHWLQLPAAGQQFEAPMPLVAVAAAQPHALALGGLWYPELVLERQCLQNHHWIRASPFAACPLQPPRLSSARSPASRAALASAPRPPRSTSSRALSQTSGCSCRSPPASLQRRAES
mmetsp:Transcript_104796/g.306019  ORF Transcript_104796/g.306019 Transcript_104796/m.306019 type:complete len:248 (-) Transcript_104796:569-1312(-)